MVTCKYHYFFIVDLQNDMSGTSILSPGNHCFEFQIRLPSDIPQSLEEPGCFIRYRLKACLRRMGNSDVITKLTFQVGTTAKLDLNIMPEARVSSNDLNLFSNEPLFLNVCNINLLKTVCEKKNCS